MTDARAPEVQERLRSPQPAGARPLTPFKWARDECARDVLAQNSRHLLIVLASYCTSERWEVRVSVDRLAKVTGRSHRDVVVSLHALKTRHLIQRKNSPKKSTAPDLWILRPEVQQ